MSNVPSAHVEHRLHNETIIWLSTVRPDGRPHLVPVWFLWQDGTIIIFSKPDQKVRNLRANNHVMLALEAANDGEDIVLIEGTAALPEQTELSPTMPVYATKYAEGLQGIGTTAEQMADVYHQAIVISPSRFRAWGGE